MAHWTQQITEAYRALQEAELVQLNESAVQGLKKVIQNAHADKANLSVAGAQVAASATKALRNMGNISHGDENHHFGDDLKPFELSEQTEYISSLENAVVALAESMNMSVEDLMEYQVSDKNRNTPKGEALAKRYAVRLRKLAAARNEKLVSDSDALGAERGTMAQGVLDARMGDRLNKALTAAGVKTHFNAEPYTPGYIKRDGEYSAIAKDTPLNISKVPEADRVMAHKEMTAMGNADRTGRRAEAASVAAAIARKRAHQENEDKWTV